MKKLTIADLATILQFDQHYKDDLIKNFESYSPGLQEEILNILWDGVFKLKEKLTNIKYEQFLQDVREGKRELTQDLYIKAEEAALQDFEDILSGKKKEIEQIDEIKNQLKSLTS